MVGSSHGRSSYKVMVGSSISREKAWWGRVIVIVGSSYGRSSYKVMVRSSISMDHGRIVYRISLPLSMLRDIHTQGHTQSGTYTHSGTYTLRDIHNLTGEAALAPVYT